MHDGDRLSFEAAVEDEQGSEQATLVFHEPASLIILDSIMPRARSQPSVGVDVAPADSAVLNRNKNSTSKLSKLFNDDREYFGSFTAFELLFMVAGTVVGAVLIFLILNYS